MAENLRVQVTVGAALSARYGRVFKGAKERAAALGDAYAAANKKLTAAGALQKYKQRLDETAAKHREVGDAAKLQLDRAEKAFGDAKAGADRYEAELEQARAKHREVGDAAKLQLDRAEKAFGDAKAGADRYEAELEQARAKHKQVGDAAKLQIDRAEKAFGDAKKTAGGYGITLDNLTGKQRALGQETKKLGEAMDRISRRQGRKQAAGDVLRDQRARALAGAGMVYAFGRMAAGAAEREEQGAYLRTVINAPDKDAAVGRAMGFSREFARRSLADEREVLDIQYALHSASFDEAMAMAATQRVHKLAKVTRGAAGTVGEVFATVVNNMGAQMGGSVDEQMDRVANVLAKTQFKFQIRDFAQLGEGMKYAAASAVQAKIPLEDTAAVIGQLNTAGLQGSMAGTGFSAMMRGWSKASDKIGFRLVRTEDGALDLMGSLGALRARLAKVGDPVAVGDMLQKGFGEEGARGVALLAEQYEALLAARAELREAGRSNLVEEEYDRFLGGSAGQWKMLGQNVRQVGEIFAGTLLPQVTAVTGWLATQAGRVSELIERYPWVGRLAGALAVGFGLVTTAAIAVAGAVWVMNAAMLANPVGLVVGALVAGAAIIYALWDPIAERVGALWQKIKGLGEVASEIGRTVKSIFGFGGDEEAPGEAATQAQGGRYRSAGDVAGAGGRPRRRGRRRGRGGAPPTAGDAAAVPAPATHGTPARGAAFRRALQAAAATAAVAAPVAPPAAVAAPVAPPAAVAAPVAPPAAVAAPVAPPAAVAAPVAPPAAVAAPVAPPAAVAAPVAPPAAVAAPVAPPAAVAAPVAPSAGADFDSMRAAGAEIGASLAAARAEAPPPAPAEEFDFEALSRQVAELDRAFDVPPGAAEAPPPPSPAAPAPAGISVVVQVGDIRIEGASPEEVAELLEERLAEIMRNAAAELRSAEG